MAKLIYVNLILEDTRLECIVGGSELTSGAVVAVSIELGQAAPFLRVSSKVIRVRLLLREQPRAERRDGVQERSEDEHGPRRRALDPALLGLVDVVGFDGRDGREAHRGERRDGPREKDLGLGVRHAVHPVVEGPDREGQNDDPPFADPRNELLQKQSLNDHTGHSLDSEQPRDVPVVEAVLLLDVVHEQGYVGAAHDAAEESERTQESKQPAPVQYHELPRRTKEDVSPSVARRVERGRLRNPPPPRPFGRIPVESLGKPQDGVPERTDQYQKRRNAHAQVGEVYGQERTKGEARAETRDDESEARRPPLRLNHVRHGAERNGHPADRAGKRVCQVVGERIETLVELNGHQPGGTEEAESHPRQHYRPPPPLVRDRPDEAARHERQRVRHEARRGRRVLGVVVPEPALGRPPVPPEFHAGSRAVVAVAEPRVPVRHDRGDYAYGRPEGQGEEQAEDHDLRRAVGRSEAAKEASHRGGRRIAVLGLRIIAEEVAGGLVSHGEVLDSISLPLALFLTPALTRKVGSVNVRKGERDYVSSRLDSSFSQLTKRVRHRVTIVLGQNPPAIRALQRGDVALKPIGRSGIKGDLLCLISRSPFVTLKSQSTCRSDSLASAELPFLLSGAFCKTVGRTSNTEC
ncbi:hypothetical protein THAOC_05821 [Thalassiosira oceanica]|uniref:Uncharacterized protein n=1 Tax=Thalassiosira oceanica TaxID=159749 RepID=K0T6C3_THAOC|nr:hypothetical protein THAOC_05821 [Thalassiosira oceanica]|eukprot:EJK72629.1 hypothetical protein THAOC_05821 [Thalassiosira oceanica]